MAMDFFSKLGNKISDTTKDVTQKAKNAMEINKLKDQISAEENLIKESYCAIGKKFFEQNAGTVDEEYVGFFNTINASTAKIAQYNAEINVKKGTYNCSACGAEVQIDAAFCPSCGNKLEPPTVVEDNKEDVVEAAPAEDNKAENN